METRNTVLKNPRATNRHDDAESVAKIAALLPDDHWAKRERIIRLSDAGRHYPQRISSAAAYRWAHSGAYGVKLEAFVEVGVYFTTIEALERFRVERNKQLKKAKPVTGPAASRTRLQAAGF